MELGFIVILLQPGELITYPIAATKIESQTIQNVAKRMLRRRVQKGWFAYLSNSSLLRPALPSLLESMLMFLTLLWAPESLMSMLMFGVSIADDESFDWFLDAIFHLFLYFFSRLAQ